MNKIYKVIWNKTLNCWNVTSELGKAHGKAASQVSQSAVESNPLSHLFFRLKLSVIAMTMALVGTNAFAYQVNGTGGGSNDNSIVIGGGTGANQASKVSSGGANSTIIGANARGIAADDGRSEGATALGQGAWATGGATALGWNARVSNTTGGVAVGADTRVSGENAMAMGWAASASGARAIAFGTGVNGDSASKANAADSIAIGTGALADNSRANNTNQGGNISIGADSYSVNFGASSQIIGDRITRGEFAVLGPNGEGTTTRMKPSAVSIGQYSKAYAGSTAVGYNNIAGTDSADGMSAFAFGSSNEATGPFALAVGLGNKSTGVSAVTLGTVNTASADTAIAIGRQTTVSGNYATAIGNIAAATGVSSFAVGHSSEANGARSIAIGSTVSPNNSYSAGTRAQGADAIALGTQAVAAQKESIAIGKDVRADGQQSIAIGSTKSDGAGQNTRAYTNNAVAIGVGAVAGINGANSSSNSQNTAVGYNAMATGHQSTAIGSDAAASGNFTTALGIGAQATSMGAMALGGLSKATADNALAQGNGAQSSGVSSVAIGSSASASLADSIALGSSSVANRAAGQAGFNTVTNTTSTETGAAWKATTAALSIGSNTVTRQIIGVAAGSADTDAVNVAQLKAAQTHYYSVNSTNTAAGSNYHNDGATGTNALAAGVNASATAQSAVAVGSNAKGLGNSTVAVGSATANAQNAIAIGNSAVTATAADSSVAMGHLAQSYNSYAVAIGSSARAGVSGDATKVGAVAIGSSARSEGSKSIALGADATASGPAAIAIGGATVTNTAGNGGTIGMGQSVSVYGQNSVAIGASMSNIGSQAAPVNNVVALGTLNSVAANGGNAIGYQNTLESGATNGIAIGRQNSVSKQALVAGWSNKVDGSNSVVLGNNNTGAATSDSISGSNANVIGGSNRVSGANASNIIGLNNSVSKANTNVIGGGNYVNAANSSVIGQNNKVSSTSSGVVLLGNSIEAGAKLVGNVFTDNTTVSNSIGIGNNVVLSGTSATAVGVNTEAAGSAFAGGSGAKALGAGSVSIGGGAGASNTQDYAISIGSGAGTTTKPTTNTENTAIGRNAGSNVTGNTNLALSSQAGQNVSGSNNMSAMLRAGRNVSGNNNIALGIDAGNNVAASNTVSIGNTATASAANTIAIGNKSTVAQANSVAIGNSITTTQANSIVLGNASTDRAATTEASATIGGVTYGTFAGQGSAAKGVLSVGSVGNERQIINVAAGKISADSTDAINGSQLYAVAEVAAKGWNIQGNGTEVAKVAPGDKVNFVNGTGTTAAVENSNGTSTVKYSVNQSGLTVADNGTVSAVNAGDNFATADQVATAINAANKTTTVVQGNNTTVSEAVNGTTTTYTVNAKNATVSAAADGGLSVTTGAENAQGVIDYAVGLSAKTQQDINDAKTTADTALQSWTYQVNAGEAKTVDKNNNAVKFADGNNINITEKDGTITVATKDTLTANTVTLTGDSAVTQGNSNAVSGDTVNTAIQNAVSDVALKFSDTAGTEISRKNGETLQVKGDNNLSVTTNATENALQLALNTTLTGLTSATFGDTVINNDGVKIGDGDKAVSLTNGGLNNGGNVISNVASGGTTESNAANIGDVQKAAAAAKTEVNAGTNVTDVVKTEGSDGQAIYTVNANGSSVSAESALKVTTGEKDDKNVTDYKIDLADKTKEDIAKGAEAAKDIAEKGLTFTADGTEKSGIKKLGDEVAITGDSNIKTVANENGVQVTLNSNLTGLDSITTNGGVVINGDGINAGDKVIRNVSDGNVAEGSKEAVNGGQLFTTNNNVANNTTEIAGNKTAIENNAGDIKTNAGNITTNTNNIANLQQQTWKLQANGDEASAVAASDTVQFKDGDNIKISRNGKDITIATSDKPTFDSVTINNGGTIEAGDNNAVTGGDVYTAIQGSEAQFTGDNGLTVKRKPAEVLKLTGGATTGTENNIQTVANENGSIAIKLAKDINLGTDGSVKTGNTTVNNDGIKIEGDNPVSLTKNGLDNGGNTIANVGAGTEKTDAVNKGQLDDLATQIAQGAKSAVVADGKNTKVTASVDGNVTTYTVDAEKTTVSAAADGGLSAVATANEETGITDYAIGLSQDSKDSLAKADTALQSWTAQVNGAEAQVVDKSNNSLNFANGNNIEITAENGAIKVATAKEVTFDKVTINNGGDVAENSTSAVNGGDVYNAIQNTESQFKGDNTDVTVKRKPSDVLSITGGATGDATSGNIKTVGNADGSIAIQLAKNLTDLANVATDSIKVGDIVEITKDGINAGNTTISNVAAGVDGKDAVNKEQLDALRTEIAAGEKSAVVEAGKNTSVEKNVEGNVTTYTVNAEKTTVSAGTNGVKVVAGEKDADGTTNYEINLDKDLVAGNDTEAGTITVKGEDGKDGVSLNGKDGTIGLNGADGANATVGVAKDGKPGVDGTDAKPRLTVNDEQVATLNDGLKFVGDNSDVTVARKLNQTLAINGGATGETTAKNIKTIGNADGSISIQLAKNLVELTSVATDSITAGDTVTINKDGIDAGGKTISNIGEGKNGTDAVNKDQLDKATAASKTEVKAGTNVTDVAVAEGDNGQTVYTVNANGTTVSTASALTVKAGEKNAENVTDYQIDLSDESKASLEKADNALQSWTAQVNGEQAKLVNQDNATVNFVDGDNIQVTNENGDIKISTSKEAKFDTVTINNGGTVEEGSKTAVNGGDVYNAIQNTTAKFKGDNDTVINRKPTDVLSITGGATGETTAKNIKTIGNADGSISIQLAKDLVELTSVATDSITAGDTVTINKDGINAGNTTISNVKDGVDGTDAVNKNQLDALRKDIADGEKTEVVKAGNNTTVDTAVDGNVTTYTVNAEKTTVSEGNGIKVAAGEKDANGVTDYKVSLDKDITVGNDDEAGTLTVKGENGKDGVTLNGKGGTIGLNGKDGVNATIGVKNGKPGLNGKDGETQPRLTVGDKQVATLEDGLKFQGDKGDVIAKQLNETLTIKGNVAENAEVTDKNIRVDNEDGNLIVKMAKELNDLTSATFGNTVINNGGVTIKDAANPEKTVSLTNGGLNNGGNQIKNVASGLGDTALADATGDTLTNVANIGDVQSAAAAARTEVKAGTNIASVVAEAGDKGQTIYTVNADGSTVTAGSELISVNAEKDTASNITDYKIDLSDKAKQSLTAAKTEVKAADGESNLTVTPKTGANGQAIYEVALSKDLAVDSLQAGATKIDGNGLTVGDVAVTADGIRAGDNKITDVAAGTISAGSKDAVNGGQLFNQGEGVKNIIGGNTVYNPETGSYTNNDIGGTGKDNIDDAIKAANDKATQAGKGWNLSVNNGVNKGNIAPDASVDLNNSDNNIVISKNGNTVTFDLNKDLAVSNLTADNSIKVGDVAVTKDGINAGNTVISNVQAAEVKQGGSDAATTGQLYNNSKSVADALGGGAAVDPNGNITAPSYTITQTDGSTVTANSVGGALNYFNREVVKPITFTADSGTHDAKLGTTVNVKGDDKNISTTMSGNTLTISMTDTPEFSRVTTGNTVMNSNGITTNNGKGPSLTTSGINAAGTKITNVADGEISATSKDAVNGSQLHAVANNLNKRIDSVDRHARAGIAGALATAGLYQAYLPGHSMVAVGAGTYRGENALAIGVSRVSDNGKIGVKLSGMSTSQGDVGGSVSVGYQW